MFSVALRMLGSRAAAEDLVHDVFLEAWRASSSFDPRRGTLRTWLMVRLRSRALDRLRSVGLTRRVDTGGEQLPEPKTAPAEDPELSPDRHAVRGVVAELPSPQRQVIELAYFSGLSASEIADRIGVPIGTVKSRTAKALASLRTEVAMGGAA
jgi:RNA polymerase sigma-70 factor (ECF subfamily)